MPDKKLISRMRIHFQVPIFNGGGIHTHCDFETWEPNEVGLKLVVDDSVGILATWERDGVKERRFIPWTNISLAEVANYDVSP